jgi:sporulation protein YlmC with PRC-barrel domain
MLRRCSNRRPIRAAGGDMSLSEDIEIVVVDVKAVARGMRVSALLGVAVTNDDDEEIGTIDDLMVENDMPGHISFAILEVGGFLGSGGRLIAIEYDSLQIRRRDDELSVVLPGATRETLEALPAFEYGS